MPKNQETGFSSLLIIILLLVFGLITGGFFWWRSYTSRDIMPKLSQVAGDPALPPTIFKPEEIKISSIKDALSKSSGQGIKCTRVPKSEITPPGMTYIKDYKIRLEGGNEELMLKPNVTGLFIGNNFWIWEANTKEGHKLKIDPADSELNLDVIAKGLDEYEQNCDFAEIDPNLFLLPEGVEFKEY